VTSSEDSVTSPTHRSKEHSKRQADDIALAGTGKVKGRLIRHTPPQKGVFFGHHVENLADR
jgi:hypothetical protein